MKVSALYSLIMGCIVLVSCSGIEGNYVTNHQDGYDTLKIYSYKFVHVYHSPDKTESYADTGTWEMHNSRINFRDWVERSEMERTKLYGRKIIFGTDIDRSWFNRDVKIWISYDREEYYIKQRSP